MTYLREGYYLYHEYMRRSKPEGQSSGININMFTTTSANGKWSESLSRCIENDIFTTTSTNSKRLWLLFSVVILVWVKSFVIFKYMLVCYIYIM